jgi:hypothetical protein
MVLRNLRRRKVHISPTVEGIAIGVAVVVALLAMGEDLASNNVLPRGTGQGTFLDL